MIRGCHRSIPHPNLVFPPIDDDDTTTHSSFAFLDNNNRYTGYRAYSGEGFPLCCAKPSRKMRRMQCRTFIHDRPIHIPYEWDFSDTRSIVRDTFLSIILLFNLALSCQLGAIRELHTRHHVRRSDSSSMENTTGGDLCSLVRTLLRRAERTYDSCLSLLVDHEDRSTGIPPLFSLAVANNRGVVLM